MGHRRLAAMAAAVWIAGLALLSFLPTQDKRQLHTKGRLHPAGHIGFFLVAAALLVASARTTRSRVLLLCLLAAFGGCVECLQHLTSGAPLEWRDIVLDLLGVLLGGLLITTAGKMRAIEPVQRG